MVYKHKVLYSNRTPTYVKLKGLRGVKTKAVRLGEVRTNMSWNYMQGQAEGTWAKTSSTSKDILASNTNKLHNDWLKNSPRAGTHIHRLGIDKKQVRLIDNKPNTGAKTRIRCGSLTIMKDSNIRNGMTSKEMTDRTEQGLILTPEENPSRCR